MIKSGQYYKNRISNMVYKMDRIGETRYYLKAVFGGDFACPSHERFSFHWELVDSSVASDSGLAI